MSRRLEDEELDRLLKEEYLNEVDELKDILLSEDDLSDQKLYTDEEIHASYGKLVERLKAEGVYREDEDESQEIPDPGKNRYGSMVKRHRIAKAAGFVIVCFLGVLAASMTSEANRNYVTKTIKYLSGTDKQVIVYNDDTNENPDQSEDKARTDIEEKLGVQVPIILYRPEGFKYLDYYVYENTKTATIEYQCDNYIVALYIYSENHDSGSENEVIHGNRIDEMKMGDNEVTATIYRTDDVDGFDSYTAIWQLNNWGYQLSGKIDKTEFEKIIKNLQF
nr:DUF4367 domain-containing protein [uncultured Blautia sp.]